MTIHVSFKGNLGEIRKTMAVFESIEKEEAINEKEHEGNNAGAMWGGQIWHTKLSKGLSPLLNPLRRRLVHDQTLSHCRPGTLSTLVRRALPILFPRIFRNRPEFGPSLRSGESSVKMRNSSYYIYRDSSMADDSSGVDLTPSSGIQIGAD